MTSKLKEAREKKGYTIEEVADILKIRKQYLLDLEEGDLKDIPGQVYVEGYSKIYYEFLGLKLPGKKTLATPVPKAVKIENKLESKHIAILSTVVLVIVVLIYVFAVAH
jgi:cytoskeletal protein RodZ